MGIVQSLSVLALRQVTIGACRAVGVIGVDAAMQFLGERFSDNSRRLSQALQGSTAKAWQALEIALAGESLWNKLDDANDRAFRLQLRAFLDCAPLEDLPARDADFRTQCLRELRAARKSGLLLGGALDSGDLAQQAANLAPFSGSTGLIEREWQALDNTAALLREAGHTSLARLVGLRPGGEQLPLIAIAVRYFFRRAVEQDAELHRGLSFAQWDALAENQQRGFEQLNEALESQGRRLDALLDLLGEVREAVLDLRQEIAGQRDQIKQLAHDVMGVLGQHQLEKRELRGGDSLSIRNDDERRMVKDLIARYRALPTEQRRGLPALLNAVGKMEVVAGNFDAARRDFEELVQIVPGERGRAEAFFNAYQAALECRRWDEALTAYRQAAGFDAERFSLFPPSKYEPERILGTGGFGVAFLCKDRHTGSRVVVKPIRADGLDRSVTEVFAEARALEELSDDSIIRLRHCDYAGGNNTRPYLVMDYFESVTLADHVAQHGPLPQEDAVVLLARVARALQKAHDRGICHRDVKPANILVAGGGVKLIDFGLALRQQMVTTTVGAASSYTQTLMGSSIAGTIDYAAPEQLGKRPGDKVGPHSDVYGLGKTACFALFGTTLPLARHWRAVPADLADLLGQCLAEDPRERPASCREVADRLTGAAAVPVTVAVPIAPVRPAVRAEDALARPPDPIPLLIVGGVFGAFAGLFAGVQRWWDPSGNSLAPAFFLMLFLSLTAGLAATAGRRRNQSARTSLIPGLPGAALGLSIPLLYLMHVFLAPYAIQYPLQHFSLGTLASIAFLLALSWGMGYGWGALFDQTAAVMVSVALIVLFGIPSQSAAFAFGGALIGGITVFVFEVVHPFRMLDQSLDKVFLILLEPIAGVVSGSRKKPHSERPAPAAKPATPAVEMPEIPASTQPSPVSFSFRLPLLLAAGGVSTMMMSMAVGAAWFGIADRDPMHLMAMLCSAGGIAGLFAILLVRGQSFRTMLLWFFGGGAVSIALMALAAAVGIYWTTSPLGMVIALMVWATIIGTLAGTRLGHPIAGFLGGLLISGLAAGSGTYFGHPDPAFLGGIAIGLLGGTLLWSQLPARWLLLARGSALALAAGVLTLLAVFQPEVGWKARSFETRGEKGDRKHAYYDYAPSGPRVVSGPALAFSRDGQRLLVAENRNVQLWDVPSGRLRDTFQVGRGSLLAVGFQNNVPVCVAAQTNEANKLQGILYNVETGAVLGSSTAVADTGQPRMTAALDDLQVRLVISDGAKVIVEELPASFGQTRKGELQIKGEVTASALAGNRLLLGFADGAIRLVESQESWQLKVVQETKKIGGTVSRVGFSPSGRHAYALGSSNPNSEKDYYPGATYDSLLAWDVENWTGFFTASSPSPYPATCAALCGDGCHLLVGTIRGDVQVWNVQAQERIRTYKLGGSFILDRTRGIRGLAVAPNGADIITSLQDNGRLLLWQTREMAGSGGATESSSPGDRL